MKGYETQRANLPNRQFTFLDVLSCYQETHMFFPTAPCRDPGVPRQGNRIGDDFRHDSKVTFSCPNGYLMEGVGEISCSNGTWSNSVPTCKGLHHTSIFAFLQKIEKTFDLVINFFANKKRANESAR